MPGRSARKRRSGCDGRMCRRLAVEDEFMTFADAVEHTMKSMGWSRRARQ